MISLRVAKMGYYGGSPEAGRSAPVTDVLDIISYVAFLSDYDFTDWKLNNPE